MKNFINKINEMNGGTFYLLLTIGSMLLLGWNIRIYEYLPGFFEGGFLIGVIAPIVIITISIKQLYKYFTIEKLEKELYMED